MGRRRRFALALFFVLTCAAVVVAILSRHSPTQIKAPQCLFYKITGLFCPGCGVTRATRRLLCGDLAGAFRYNPLVLMMAPVLFVQSVCYFYDLWRDRFPYRRGSFTLAVLCVAVILVFMVARNLPFEACDWLRPPAGPCP